MSAASEYKTICTSIQSTKGMLSLMSSKYSVFLSIIHDSDTTKGTEYTNSSYYIYLRFINRHSPVLCQR